MKFMNNLLLWQRFALLGILGLILFSVPSYLYFTKLHKTITFIQTKKLGIAPIRLIVELYKSVQDDWDLKIQVAMGITAQTQIKKQTKLKKQLIYIEKAIQQTQWNNTLSHHHWPLIRQDIEALATVGNQSVNSILKTNKHLEILTKIRGFYIALVEHYGLNRDTDRFTSYMVRVLTYDLISIIESIALIRIMGINLLHRTNQTSFTDIIDKDIDNLTHQVSLVRVNLAILKEHAKQATAKDSDKDDTFSTTLKLVITAIETALNLTEDKIINVKTLDYDTKKYYKTATKAYKISVQFQETILTTLENTIQKRLYNLKHTRFFVEILILITAILMLLLTLWILWGIVSPIKHLTEIIYHITSGDTGVKAALDSQDEIGQLAKHFDNMITKQEAISQKIQAENEQLNNSIIALLEAVAKVSQRDLTVKIPIASDLTGPLSDALNLLTYEMASALQQISEISTNVTQASFRVQEQSDLVSSVAESERDQVEKTATELDNAASNMANIAKLAQISNIAADKAIEITEKALVTVDTTVTGIENIQVTIREAGTRVELLGVHSQEISGVVDLISGIARRTQILAVSASMHAASAGEAGHGFQIIANEVQRLAETAQQAATKISSLVETIQSEVENTISTMNIVTQQITDGSNLAKQAGEQMNVNKYTTSDLVSSVQMIVESSQEQVQVSAELLNRAQNIRKSNQLTNKQLKSQAIQTENLVKYASNLLKVIQVFKLPTT